MINFNGTKRAQVHKDRGVKFQVKILTETDLISKSMFIVSCCFVGFCRIMAVRKKSEMNDVLQVHKAKR